MALLVKILLVTGILGIIAFAYVAYLQQTSIVANLDTIKTTQGELDTAKVTISKDEKDLTDAKAKESETESQLSQVTQSKTNLESEVAADKTKLASIQKDMDEKTADFQKTSDELTQLKADLNGDTPDSLRTKAIALQQTLAQDEVEKKILIDNLEKAQVQLDKVQRVVKNFNNQVYLMPPLSGKVKFVDRTWNFVVLDVGTLQGVIPRGELSVYRGRSFLGKLKISSADTDSSVADIEPDIKGSVEVGDDVVSQ